MLAPAPTSKHGRGFWIALFAALASACSSDERAEPDIWVEFQSLASQVREGEISDQVRVVLRTRLAELPEAVTFELVASEFSTAHAGIDFAPIPLEGFTFHAGSRDGTSLIVDIAALADQRFERNIETLRLELSGPGGSARLGAWTSHEVQILDQDVAAVEFVSTHATHSGESGAAAIEFELILEDGVLLDAPLAVGLRATQVGFAEAGVDYALPELLFVPAGARRGDHFAFEVDVLEDGQLEGNESAQLELFVPDFEHVLAPSSDFVLTLEDDEAGVGRQLLVRGDPLEVGTLLDPGATLEMPANLGGAGLGPSVTARLSSLGAETVAVELPLIAGPQEREFAVRFADVVEEDIAGPSEPIVRPAPLFALAVDTADTAEVAFEPELFEDAPTARRQRWLDVPTAFGPMVLDLERLPSAWSADAELALDGERVERTSAELAHWRGRVADDPRSDVMISLGPRALYGWVRRGDGAVQHWTTAREDHAARRSAVRESTLQRSASRALEIPCREPRATVGVDAPRLSAFGGERGPVATWPTARLAIETDFQLYSRFQNVDALIDYVTALVAAASARYQTDVGVRLEIAYLGVHTRVDDGWSAPDSSDSVLAVLDEFQHAWAPAWGGSKPVPAHLAHFLSGAELDGGVAYIGTLCDANWGFAVSSRLNAAISWPGWSGASGPLMWDFFVFAHELGHNFGSLHTHSYCPPLDQCFASCSAPEFCSRGTLMSYCHLCGGVENVDLELHPFTANVMRSQVTTSCLGEILLPPGTAVDWSLQYRPSGTASTSEASASFEHDALNHAPAFELHLSGSSSP